MNPVFSNLLIPITGLICGLILIGCLLYLKGKEISIVRLVIWVFWVLLLFGILGFISAKIENLNWVFFTVTLGSLLYGILYLVVAPVTLSWWRRSVLTDIFFTAFIFLCFGISGFSLIYSTLSVSGAEVGYFLVGITAFLFPSLVIKSYDYWMLIPAKKYKTWVYPVHGDVPQLQPVDPIRLVMNFTPAPSGKNGSFEGYEVEFPSNISVGDLFHYFISFHNKHREYRKKPIQYLDGERPLEWVLFKYSGQNKKIYLDMDKTLIENSIGSNESIYALSSN